MEPLLEQPIYTDHLCEDMKPTKRTPHLTPRSVALFRSLDKRWLVGECRRCHQIITREMK